MTVATFPTVATDYPIIIKPHYKTIRTQMDSGVWQVRKQWRFPVREVTIPLGKLSVTNLATIEDFFTDRAGSFDPFWWFNLRVKHHKDEYVGYGTGSPATYDLHSKETVNDVTLIIYDNGSPISKTFYSGTGLGGADQVAVNVTLGHLITSDFWGKIRLKVFGQDEFTDEWFRHLHSKTEMHLIEQHW